jgi:hypothetical protein
MAERTTCNRVDEAPKAKFVVESQHGGVAHLLAGHRASFDIMLLHLDTSLCSLQATIIDNSDISKN